MKKFLLSMMLLASGAMCMNAEDYLTVADGTSTNGNAPINSMWWDTSGTNTQVIYAEDLLSAMKGGKILGVHYYVANNGTQFSGGKANILAGITENTEFSLYGTTDIEGLEVVAADITAPEVGSMEFEYMFDEPLDYNGGNLVIEFKVTEAGGYGNTQYYGTQPGYVMVSRGTAYQFMPKTTFIYELEAKEYDARVAPATLDFGKLMPGTEAELTFTISNKGLNAFTPAVSGIEAPFSTTYQASELASDENVAVTVKFAPAEVGNYTGTVTVDCGQAGSFEVALNGKCSTEQEITVCDGEDTDRYTPIYTAYFDTKNTYTQTIYPAELLQDIEGLQITGLKFYPKEAMGVQNATHVLSVGETEQTTFTRESSIAVPTDLITGLTDVCTLTLVGGENELVYEFDTPYTYNGGNLALNTLVTVAGKYAHTFFYGVSKDYGTAYCDWGGSGKNTMEQFLPKMTIMYQPATEVVTTVTASGTVTDVVTGDPIEGVTVTLTVHEPAADQPAGMRRAEGEAVTYTATTDAQGAYSMEVTPVDGATYSMSFAKEGYQSLIIDNVDLNDPQNVSLEQDASTGIADINAAVEGKVTYVNVMGQSSDRPFQGVNIVVKDGKAVAKVIK
ncbi:MAG: carboxypeptidase regulatory-like domain-containing protein [Muribaculaceae bacterium]|nr:carboxypeptidase regulatory-like domain-containing protein [Muribaculaceae bacterium]